MGRAQIDIPMGTVFGGWTVVGGPIQKSLKKYYVCACECGAQREIYQYHLRSGQSSSCGCRAAASTARRSTKHGMTGSPEYRVWRAMIDRCCRKRSRRFKDYGGRGIGVCPRWRDSFESFYEDMGPRPSKSHSLDRIDNDAGYSLENCRWATLVEQARNKSIQRDTASGRVGVTPSGDGKWMARIMCEGRSIFLGTYSDMRDAISARVAGEKEFWGAQQ